MVIVAEPARYGVRRSRIDGGDKLDAIMMLQVEIGISIAEVYLD